MDNWPTQSDIVWLILGLIPIGLILFRVFFVNSQEFSSLGTIFVFSLWIGYHLTPWIAVPQGGWTSFLLRAEYLTEGIRFATLSMIFFMLGYFPFLRYFDFVKPASLSVRLDGFSSISRFVNVKASTVLIFSIIILLLLTMRVEGISELLSSTKTRGEGQFDERDFVGNIYHVLDIGIPLLSLILAFMASGHILVSQRRDLFVRLPVGILGLLIASTPHFHEFSRLSGFSLFVLTFVSIWMKGIRALPLAVVFISMGIYLSMIGFTQRGEYNPGLANFASAAINPNKEKLAGTFWGAADNDREQGWIQPTANPLNALDPWTTRIWTRGDEKIDFMDSAVNLIQIIQPMPSFIVSWRAWAGEHLSIVLNTWGTFNINTPAMAEIYYLFDIWGLLFLILFGILTAWLECKRNSLGGVWSLILLVAFSMGSVIGLHNGLRAMTRPILYVIIILLIRRCVVLWNQSYYKSNYLPVVRRKYKVQRRIYNFNFKKHSRSIRDRAL